MFATAMQVRPSRSPRGAARRLRRAALAAVAALLVISLTSCSSPVTRLLETTAVQRGMAICMPTPNPGAHVYSWDTPVAFNLDMFLNQSHQALVITAVTLIDPHNLHLDGALVYEMPHSQHPLALNAALSFEGSQVPPYLWARRQKVPGAVIGPGHPAPINKVLATTNLYEISPVISSATRAGGWALGEVVTYRAAGHTYSVRIQSGYAIGSAKLPLAASCDAPLSAINKAWGMS
jgi:hypothetical protein